MKQIIVSMLLLSTSLLANVTVNHDGDHLGSAIHSGVGKINHDGDFIEFNLNFEAACYSDRGTSWDNVSHNVSSFLAWLEEEAAHTGEDLNYYIAPINLWRNDYGYGTGLCVGTYNASQGVKVTYSKAPGTASLHTDTIQDFYARLQGAVWPLNRTESGETDAHVTTSITSIEKGLYEETADSLRIAAKAKAQAKATREFRAFLGDDYHGTWYLQKVDFREQNYLPYYRTSVDSYPAPAVPPSGGGGSLPAPAQLKLDPITVSIAGEFHFVFDVRYWHL